MAFFKRNGELNHIPTDIYLWLEGVSVKDVDVDTIATGDNNDMLDIDGNQVVLVDGNIPEGTELRHQLIPSNEWTFTFLPYSSRDVSIELRSKSRTAQGPPVIIKATEAKSEEWQIPAGKNIKEIGYIHPLLRENIPDDWEDYL